MLRSPRAPIIPKDGMESATLPPVRGKRLTIASAPMERREFRDQKVKETIQELRIRATRNPNL